MYDRRDKCSILIHENSSFLDKRVYDQSLILEERAES